jgi:hypothetical protein
MKKVIFATIATFLLPFVAKATEYGDSLKITIPQRKDFVEPRKEITFVGIPIFLSGIIAKGEKKSFRQNTKDNKHTLVTDFKTNIETRGHQDTQQRLLPEPQFYTKNTAQPSLHGIQ